MDFHIFFDTISVNQFYIDVWEIKELTPDVWSRMGADYLVEGTLELKGDDIVVAYKISELHPKVQEMKEEKLRTKRANAGELRTWLVTPQSGRLQPKSHSLRPESPSCAPPPDAKRFGCVTMTAPIRCA